MKKTNPLPLTNHKKNYSRKKGMCTSVDLYGPLSRVALHCHAVHCFPDNPPPPPCWY